MGLGPRTAQGVGIPVVHRSGTWLGLSGHPKNREPGRAEQQLCSLIGQGLGRLAVLLLDSGVEKPSRI
jgi:hypothetical protein